MFVALISKHYQSLLATVSRGGTRPSPPLLFQPTAFAMKTLSNRSHAALLMVAATLYLKASATATNEVEVGLPADLAHRPAATTCSALRSGHYRLLTPTLDGTLADQTSKVLVDAATLTVIRADGKRVTSEAQGECRFTEAGTEGDRTDYVVSQAGLIAGRVSVNGGGSYRSVFGVPEQVHSVVELAGTWNTIGLRGPANGLYAGAGQVSFDRKGATIAATECGNPVTWATDVCANVATGALEAIKPYEADASGGFVSRSGTRTNRLFLYGAASGPPMMIAIGSDGALSFGTPAQPMLLPSAGTTKTRWNLDMTGRLVSVTSIYTTIGTEVSVDLTESSWMRRKKGLLLPDDHLEKLYANNPRAGYLTRPAGEAATSGGSTVHFNELTALALPGTGVQPVILPKVKLFEIVVIAP